ncbi:hypothetical protein OSB04_030297 [Centaurea solstitialis]|uniref:Exocyst component Exo84 C-terminal domain-containing protein n=1 Tax=Centaurea solstitialis TaxID=347529 RepID=A0AA38S8I2_9ASTR|nr:hypothetical protein OSB04_030297 [Centaurea solstitialis]
MASKLSSRSRGGAPVKPNSKETGPKLEENLNIFKSDKFDADGFVNSKCNSLNEKNGKKVRHVDMKMEHSSVNNLLLVNILKTEDVFSLKEIRQLCSYLLDLKKASAEEMGRSVYANYTAFIRTSKEISDLEGELLSIRNLLSTQATLIHGLAEGVHVDSLSIAVPGGNGLSPDVDRDPSDLENWLIEFPDILDVLLAERRVEEALATLDEGERVASEAKEKDSLSPVVLKSLQMAITECRQRLANQLADAASQPTTRGSELRAAISALKKLGDGPRAHSLLLQAHYQRLQSNMQTLRPSSTSYGGAYTAAISQLVFSVIAQTATDSNAIFGNEPAYSSELVMWATKQTEDFALLVKRHALASSAAAGGLRAAAECVQIAMGHCSLLEARGLALCPVLLKLFRPSVEQALDANLKRIEESTAALAAADDWDLSSSPTVTRLSGRPSSTSLNAISAYQHKLSSSAQRFNMMVQHAHKSTPRLHGRRSKLRGSGNKIVRMAETEAQQMALLANASLLADELLPRAAMKLTPVAQAIDPRRRPSDRQNRNPEQREWKRRLASIVDRLKDSFCRQHALDLIFTEDGDSHLTADMYINMDGSVEEIEWFPSPIFQELYAKLYRMSAIAAEMFVGRERFSTMLLMRLTETVILWLSEDQAFWDDIEEGPRPLGPLGLQQFYLDMKFVISFASQGRYLSRNLNRVVNEIISKALASFAATGVDPYGVLPEDEWFGDICQDAIERLSGKPRLANGERDLSTLLLLFQHNRYRPSDLMGAPKAIDSPLVYLGSAYCNISFVIIEFYFSI